MIEKYIKLLLHGCLDLKSNKPLFISYDEINEDFVDELVKYANQYGISDIYLYKQNMFDEHNVFIKSSLEEIEKSSYFDESVWDLYVQKNAAFLILITEIPNLMDDISSDKISVAMKKRRESRPLYREKTLNNELAWCIAALPNIHWAKDLFPNSENPLDEFWDNLSKIVLLDKKDPVKSWKDLLKVNENIANKLNKLEIKKIIYKNKLGTNLKVELPENVLWATACDSKWIVNMPSFEIFTTPNYKKTNGVVYSSKPLIYNGKIIDDFYLKFKNGKVVGFDAKKGKDTLKEIINADKYSAYLGECALVNYDSPISNSNIVFKTTLLDENASCHLALGAGFNECIKDGLKMDEKRLLNEGINPSKLHVDFMIGTPDLEIVAETPNGRVTIMSDGNIVL